MGTGFRAPSVLFGGLWQEIQWEGESEAGFAAVALGFLSEGRRNEAGKFTAPAGSLPCAVLSRSQDHVGPGGGLVPTLPNPGLLKC